MNCLGALRFLTLIPHAHALLPGNVGIDRELLVLLPPPGPNELVKCVF